MSTGASYSVKQVLNKKMKPMVSDKHRKVGVSFLMFRAMTYVTVRLYKVWGDHLPDPIVLGGEYRLNRAPKRLQRVIARVFGVGMRGCSKE